MLRNPALADRFGNRPGGSLEGPALARATFQGGWWKHHHHHHHRYFKSVFVIGFVGPLFWPYAYYDFVDYTFYPYAYDTFWPSAYDDLYDGMYGPYAQDDGYGGGSYPAAGRPQGPGVSAGGGGGRAAGGPAAAEICTGKTAGLTDWPIERISKRVEPNEAQRAAPRRAQDRHGHRAQNPQGGLPDRSAEHPDAAARGHAQAARRHVEGRAHRAARASEVLPLPGRRAEGALQCAPFRQEPATGPTRPVAIVRPARSRYRQPADRTDRNCGTAHRGPTRHAQGAGGRHGRRGQSADIGLPDQPAVGTGRSPGSDGAAAQCDVAGGDDRAARP